MEQMKGKDIKKIEVIDNDKKSKMGFSMEVTKRRIGKVKQFFNDWSDKRKEWDAKAGERRQNEIQALKQEITIDKLKHTKEKVKHQSERETAKLKKELESMKETSDDGLGLDMGATGSSMMGGDGLGLNLDMGMQPPKKKKKGYKAKADEGTYFTGDNDYIG